MPFSRMSFGAAAPIAALAGLCVFLGSLSAAEPKDRVDGNGMPRRVAFVGLHGGVFEILKGLAGPSSLRVEYVTDEQIAAEAVDLSRYQLVLPPACPRRGRRPLSTPDPRRQARQPGTSA